MGNFEKLELATPLRKRSRATDTYQYFYRIHKNEEYAEIKVIHNGEEYIFLIDIAVLKRLREEVTRLYILKNANSHPYLVVSPKEDTSKKIVIGRYLLNPPEDKVVDHINGNTLDNRLSNLRVVTRNVNMRNRESFNKSTGFKGVHKKKLPNGQIVYRATLELGTYINIEDAKKAFEEAYQLLFPDACLR